MLLLRRTSHGLTIVKVNSVGSAILSGTPEALVGTLWTDVGKRCHHCSCCADSCFPIPGSIYRDILACGFNSLGSLFAIHYNEAKEGIGLCTKGIRTNISTKQKWTVDLAVHFLFCRDH
jgi:hypothetical protein